MKKYNLSLYSIFRDSTSYLQRYFEQIKSLTPYFDRVQLTWLEGDSEDDTWNWLKSEKAQCDYGNLYRTTQDTGVYVDLIKLDTLGPYWPSVNNSLRWRQLEAVWNACIQDKYDTEVVVCVESDLIWEAQDLLDTVALVRDGVCDVAYPSIFLNNTQRWWDTNGFSRNGQKFTNEHPYIPGTPVDDLVEVDTGGGMIACSNIAFEYANWQDTCVLNFPDWTTRLLNRRTVIYHP